MLNEPMRSAVEQAARLLPTAEASGSIVYFDGAADSVPLANLTVDASATKITVCGKNLLNDIDPILLKDKNTIFPDVGDISLTYRKDIGLALAKLEAMILENGGN